jgi:hypothetical protein
MNDHLSARIAKETRLQGARVERIHPSLRQGEINSGGSRAWER